MLYKNTDELIRKLSTKPLKVATKELAKFYAQARFNINDDDFNRQFTDGKFDGGIDFYHKEDDAFYIFQSKFSGTSKNADLTEIMNEINKIRNTISGENQNKQAQEFINALKRETGNEKAALEIVFVTTNKVKETIQKDVQRNLEEWQKKEKWAIVIDFVVKDKFGLENTIIDIEHGFVPQTGKRTLKLEEGQWIEHISTDTGVYSIICSVYVNDLLSWFGSSNEINNSLQKNVREFLGEAGKISNNISDSYESDPDWFWYKHNGIIIFADSMNIDRNTKRLTLRNPQVVNGGQTISSLFRTYDKNQRKENSSKVLLRVYRLPYDQTETYKISIDIISALNSQNKINPSDLKSTDPRQVMLERLFNNLGYTYFRKRSKEAKSSQNNVTMRNLALLAYVCRKNSPRAGVTGNIEEIFETEEKYNVTFPEEHIKKDLTYSSNHVVMDYLIIWNIDQTLKTTKRDLPLKDQEEFKFKKWYVLADVYGKLENWHKSKSFSWKKFSDFIDSSEFYDAVYQYSKSAFKIATEILPRNEEAINYYKTKTAENRFFSKTNPIDFERLIEKKYVKWENDSD